MNCGLKPLKMLDIRENFEQIIHEKMLALRNSRFLIGENPFAPKGFFTRVKKQFRESMDIVINFAAPPSCVGLYIR